jgi:uncharacterized protein DUF3987
MPESPNVITPIIGTTPAITEGNPSGESLVFPESAIGGSVGDLARLLADGTEVPTEFCYACGLTALGWLCSTKLRLRIGVEVEPRLYTVLLGASYDARKSTAMRKVMSFFNRVIGSLELVSAPHVIYGVGSAEGLMRELNDHAELLLCYDELRTFVDKCRVQNSSLLPMTTSLFDNHNWDNHTKHSRASASIRGASLSLIGCCTTATYANMWTNEAIAIGFPNRLFIVSADRKIKVAWPKVPDESSLNALQARIVNQLKKLPLTFNVADDAKARWEQWYTNLPPSEHSKRLDTIGLRLLALITLTTDKDEVDLETVETVLTILDYELAIRRVTDPVDADNTIAILEERIRRALTSRGPLRKRDMRRNVNADRYGLWAFDTAISNLTRAGDILERGGVYSLGAAA